LPRARARSRALPEVPGPTDKSGWREAAAADGARFREIGRRLLATAPPGSTLPPGVRLRRVGRTRPREWFKE